MRAVSKISEIINPKTKVVLFNAIEHHFIETIAFSQATLSGMTTQLIPQSKVLQIKKQKGIELLNRAKERLDKLPISVETRVIEDEKPEEYILRVVKEENFDLVVLGCKGKHSKLKRVVLGTVPTEILNKVSCDVLIVR